MLPPMGPFLDNILWLGVLAALVVVALKLYARRLGHPHDLGHAGRHMLASIVGVLGLRDPYRGPMPSGDPADPIANDLLDRWCRNELQRIEDERQRLEVRHRDLKNMADRLRGRSRATDERAEKGAAPTPDGAAVT